ncbi:MAG: hypothetical protein ACXACC_00750 [Promethearchaeota archaeon]|jgi:hypothetical protein
MEQAFKLLKIACPSCGSVKELKIPDSIFSEKKMGFIKIQVPQGAVCNEHIFMVLTDPKGKVLGYETFDVAISKPKEQFEDIKEEQSTGPTLRGLIKTFGFNCIAGLIHAKLFGYSSFMVSSLELNIDISELKNTIESIIPKTYRNSSTIDKIEYDGETFPRPGYYYSILTSRRNNVFLINPYKHIVQSPWEIDIEYEQMIINHALKRDENGIQFKILTEFLQRLLKDVDEAKFILENCKKISEKDLIKELNARLTLSSINKSRMRLIKEFINRRISPELAAKIKKK